MPITPISNACSDNNIVNLSLNDFFSSKVKLYGVNYIDLTIYDKVRRLIGIYLIAV